MIQEALSFGSQKVTTFCRGPAAVRLDSTAIAQARDLTCSISQLVGPKVVISFFSQLYPLSTSSVSYSRFGRRSFFRSLFSSPLFGGKSFLFLLAQFGSKQAVVRRAMISGHACLKTASFSWLAPSKTAWQHLSARSFCS